MYISLLLTIQRTVFSECELLHTYQFVMILFVLAYSKGAKLDHWWKLMLALFVTENLGGIYFCYMVAGTKFKILENVLKNSSLFPYTAIHYVQTITCPGVKKLPIPFHLIIRISHKSYYLL